MPSKYIRGPLAVRFWPKVDKDGPTLRPELGPCWLWTGMRASNVYGVIRAGGGSRAPLGAHRVSWRLHYGDDLGERWVLHHCDNRPCVNPSHLFIGTPLDNVIDMVSKERQGRGAAINTARLTEAQVREIRQRLAAGERQNSLAQEFRVAVTTISNVHRRLTWKHGVLRTKT